MTVWEEKEITIRKKVEKEIKCDICGNTIVGKTIKPHFYYTVMTGHHEWGNDSVDSIVYKDVCSDSCLQIAFNEYISKQVKEYHTAYFEVDREFGKIGGD